MGFWLPWKRKFWSNLPQNHMQPFPHPSDDTHKIWSRLANWLQRYSSLKVWTTTDGRRTIDILLAHPVSLRLRWAKKLHELGWDSKANPRDVYRYINGQKKDTHPPLKRRNGNGVAESKLEHADEFNDQFTDAFNKNEHSQVPLQNRSAPFMNDIVVSAVGVTKLLKGLNPSKALGPDELHPRVLKELASELGPVFAHLFQQSIATGEIPKEWSLSNICPLFKKEICL